MTIDTALTELVNAAEAIRAAATKTLAETNRIDHQKDDPVTMNNTNDTPYVLVRGANSGVFTGHLKHHHGTEVHLTDYRHIWYWSGAAATDELAMRGPANPKDCKFTGPHPAITILDAITIIPCTAFATEHIINVPEWTENG